MNFESSLTNKGIPKSNEFGFMLDFVRSADFRYEVCFGQLRSLWTAYCLHNDMDCDTAAYDADLSDVYGLAMKNDTFTQRIDSGIEDKFELFDLYMGKGLS